MPAFFDSDLLPLLVLNIFLWLWVWAVPTLVLRFPFLPGGILGVALPGVILVRAETYSWAILRHELWHVRQMRRWSPLGICLAQVFNYLLRPLAILLVQGRWPGLGELYRTHPLERAAFAAMDRNDALPRTWGARP